jgi:hypothetical protein
MKTLNRLCIYDAGGTEVAYVNNGIIYATSSGLKIGRILGGVIYGVDGQALGRRTTFGSVRGMEGATPDAFMRLVKGK